MAERAELAAGALTMCDEGEGEGETMMSFDDRRDYYTDGQYSADCMSDEEAAMVMRVGSQAVLDRALELEAEFGVWGEHPHPALREQVWFNAVLGRATRDGYWEWVARQLMAREAKG